MDVNALLVKQKRTENGWTQQHLADACGLSIRTIQRVERYGQASNETVSSLCAVFHFSREQIISAPIQVEIEIEEKALSSSRGLFYKLIIYCLGMATGMIISQVLG